MASVRRRTHVPPIEEESSANPPSDADFIAGIREICPEIDIDSIDHSDSDDGISLRIKLGEVTDTLQPFLDLCRRKSRTAYLYVKNRITRLHITAKDESDAADLDFTSDGPFELVPGKRYLLSGQNIENLRILDKGGHIFVQPGDQIGYSTNGSGTEGEMPSNVRSESAPRPITSKPSGAGACFFAVVILLTICSIIGGVIWGTTP